MIKRIVALIFLGICLSTSALAQGGSFSCTIASIRPALAQALTA